MSIRKTCLMAALAIFGLCASSAYAAPIQWDVDSSLSSVKLSIPDQKINISGTAATLRVRNQNNNTWTTNVAAVDGFINTNYNDGSSIQFLNNPLGQLVGLNSGTYRPNPAAFNPANTNADNPDGQFQNASGAPGVIGAKIRALALAIITIDLAMMNIYDMSFDLASGVLPIAGTSFNATGASFGIAQSTAAIDGLSGLAGQPIPDVFSPFGPIFDVNTAAGGLVTIPDPINQPLLRRLQIPINIPTSYDLEGVPLTATISGTLVAFAIVPEPSSFLLAGMGMVSVFLYARRRRRNRA